MTKATASEILNSAAKHMRDRASTYDKPEGERSARATAEAFNTITSRKGDRSLSEVDVWLLLQVLKQVRLFSRPGFHQDSAEDNVAYGALLAEAMAMRSEVPAPSVTPAPVELPSRVGSKTVESRWPFFVFGKGAHR